MTAAPITPTRHPSPAGEKGSVVHAGGAEK